MSRATINMDYKLKHRFTELKWAYQEMLGIELTDAEFLRLLLDFYEKHKHLNFAELLKEITQKLYDIMDRNEEYLRLKAENERLKQENEALRQELRKAKDNAIEGLTSRQLFWKFIDKVKEEMGNHPSKDEVINKLLEIGMQIFKGDRIRPAAVLKLSFEVI